MDLIVFAHIESTYQKRLLAQLGVLMPRDRIILCRTVEELAGSLMRPLDTVLAVVLLISQSTELVGIISLGSMLHDVRIILILPAADIVMAARALPLRPRFVTYEDENSDEIIAVVAKLMSARQKQIPPPLCR